MKALSATQIKTCETSVKPRCRCRCHGALHGVRQNGYVQVLLIPDDENAHLTREVATNLGTAEVVKAWLDEP